MKENDTKAAQMEYAMRAMENPEWRHSAEFRQWLEEADNRKLFIELMAYNEALKREQTHKQAPQKPQPEKRGPAKWLFPATMAAAAALALLLGWYALLPDKPSEPQQLFFATAEMPEGILLQASTQPPVLLQDSLMDMRSVLSELDTTEYFTLTIPRGKDFKLVLSDGTEVRLNAETTLRYPNHFTGDTREVTLTGEAFFHVARNESQPFIVQTEQIKTQVLGTSFNVRSYTDEMPHVTLVSGSVRVKRNASEGDGTLLQPGQDLCYTADGAEKLTYVNTEEYTAWTEGLFYFADAPLKEIMRTLGRWYNVNILFDKASTENVCLNFWTDRNAPVEETIKLLNKVGDIALTIQNGTIYINHL